LEYHIRVWHSVPASVAAFGLLAFCFASSLAQTGPTVTSPVVGGHPPAVVPFTGTVGLTRPLPNPGSRPIPPAAVETHHHHHDGFAPALIYPVPVPYAVDLSANGNGYNDADDDSDANYQGGPTVFDRRGAGADSYVPPVRDASPVHEAANSGGAAAEPPQTPTLLLFKDGHRLEVANYAIIGDTLFDLTPGHARRVALADLNLDATREQNEDRGVVFQLPVHNSQAN
jgi:hypothetical protein